MSARDLEQALLDMFDTGEIDAEGMLIRVEAVSSFGRMATEDCGIVVRMQDGSEYQMAIVQTKGPRS